ncbi:LysR family transcriptional regulator [Alicyclobacillus sp.]|uniref:LysR family transcriptional regulator n=1 Tax=Alicyclobacillus sp. TaxID=61169 RepID=UPI0025C6498C|nr:LysR family transcriptional regulator [Alicyclobacillus sp.]MCL6516297.1 LysR family transcriptional regulator [Alicyclobacillus sp.]
MHPLYETFVQVVEQETMVKAAEALHLTQPTLTRQVRQLEAELGMPLFDRVGKRLVLNRAGELVYRYAKRCLNEDRRMREELSTLADPEAGLVQLGAGLTPSIYLLPPILSAYRRAHPRVRFAVRTGSSRQVLGWLEAREIDLAVVTTAPAEGDEWIVRPLWRDDLLPVAAPDSDLAQSGSTRFAELAQRPAVLMGAGSGLRAWMNELARRHGVTLEMAMETDSLESISRLVQLGVGWSVLPRSCAEADVASGRLAVVSLTDVDLGARTITLVTRRDSLLPACVARFMGALPGLWPGPLGEETAQ